MSKLEEKKTRRELFKWTAALGGDVVISLQPESAQAAGSWSPEPRRRRRRRRW